MLLAFEIMHSQNQSLFRDCSLIVTRLAYSIPCTFVAHYLRDDNQFEPINVRELCAAIVNAPHIPNSLKIIQDRLTASKLDRRIHVLKTEFQLSRKNPSNESPVTQGIRQDQPIQVCSLLPIEITLQLTLTKSCDCFAAIAPCHHTCTISSSIGMPKIFARVQFPGGMIAFHHLQIPDGTARNCITSVHSIRLPSGIWTAPVPFEIEVGTFSDLLDTSFASSKPHVEQLIPSGNRSLRQTTFVSMSNTLILWFHVIR
jgi:hypothetical protein